jgi:hypothetical protein
MPIGSLRESCTQGPRARSGTRAFPRTRSGSSYAKRELKPNYARQFGPVEVWDVRDVPFRHCRRGDDSSSIVLDGAEFPCGTHDTCFWYIGREYPL